MFGVKVKGIEKRDKNMKEQQLNAIKELKRRGFGVFATADGSFLIERETFWGKFSWDTGLNRQTGGLKWGRTIFFCLIYGIGLLGIAWWLWKKETLKNEVLVFASNL